MKAKSNLLLTPVLLAIVSIAASMAYGGAVGIDIISQQFYVEGGTSGNIVTNPQAPEGEWIWEPTDDSYEIMDSTPLGGDCSSQQYTRSWSDPSQWYTVDVIAESIAGDFGVSALTDCGGVLFAGSPAAHALATSTYLFRPDYDSLQIELILSGDACLYTWMGEGCGFRLTDLTLNSVIDEDGWAGLWHFMMQGESPTRTYGALNPSNEYELFLWSRTVIGGDDDGCYSLSFDMNIVPEPATVLLLALGAVMLRRKRS